MKTKTLILPFVVAAFAAACATVVDETPTEAPDETSAEAPSDEDEGQGKGRPPGK